MNAFTYIVHFLDGGGQEVNMSLVEYTTAPLFYRAGIGSFQMKLRICAGYRTMSTEASQVISRVTIKERVSFQRSSENIYHVRGETIGKWQSRLEKLEGKAL